MSKPATSSEVSDLPSEQTCNSDSTREYGLRFLFTAITLAAIWISLYAVTNVASKIVLAVYVLTYLFGCWRTRRAVLFVLPAMYIPYVWLFWDWQDWPWRNYRWDWISMMWTLPGLLAEMMVHPLNEPMFSVVTVMATLSAFFLFVFPARVGWRSAAVVSTLVFAVSIVNSMLCYAIYRA